MINSPTVKILIDISPEHYDRLLSRFTEESCIYAILKNGVVIHHFEGSNNFRMVEICKNPNFMKQTVKDHVGMHSGGP